jgi:hypothetical protein
MANFIQNTLQNIATALGLSEPPPSWATRLREEIQLTAPDGTIFTARWRGNTRSIPNKIGIHTFFGVSGAKIQKGGTGPEVYDLSIIFGGVDNDRNAAAFMDIYKSTSTLDADWQIEHPTKGPLFGTFVTVTENDFPVDSGNLTIINCPFIINLPDTDEETAAQAQARAAAQAEQLNDTSSDQFEFISKLETPDEIQAIITATQKGVSAVRSTLSLINNADPGIQTEIDSIITGINNTLSQDTIDTLTLSRQVQALIQTYGDGQDSATTAIDMFSGFVTEFIGLSPDQPTSAGISTMAITELYTTAALTAACQTALIGGITSRQEALTAIEKLNDIMDTLTNGLDEIQQLYNDNPINTRYFSQSSSYADAIVMVDNAQRFLLISLFGLPRERRIILKENKFVPQIAYDEYGSMSTPDTDFGNVDKLIASNDLHGDEMYWLEAGREVLIYQ